MGVLGFVLGAWKFGIQVYEVGSAEARGILSLREIGSRCSFRCSCVRRSLDLKSYSTMLNSGGLKGGLEGFGARGISSSQKPALRQT